MVKAAAKTGALLGWMGSLSDATRLRLLRLLERHELGVADLCDVLQLPQSTVSRHLKTLSDQGWVRSRRQATNHLYRTILDELEAPARKLWLLAREQTDDWPTVRQDRLRLDERLRARHTDAGAFFAGAAAEWDRLRAELYGRTFTHAATLALLSPEMVVADLGCGTASVAAQLAPHVGRVIAVDNSAAMLKAARKRTAGLKNVDLRQGDLDVRRGPRGRALGSEADPETRRKSGGGGPAPARPRRLPPPDGAAPRGVRPQGPRKDNGRGRAAAD
jgi:DNA-binding transcriptional ArsR family regulator